MDVTFGDASFSLVDLQEVLRDAARGRVRSLDPEDRMNPDSWAVALAAHVARVHGAPSLTGAVGELLASADLRALLVDIDPERVLYAASLPTAARVEDFISQLRESLRAHGRPALSDATERRLEAMIVTRRAAGR